MLRDDAWLKIASEAKLLCSQCMFRRAQAAQVKLTFADLQPCLMNLECPRPVSWFARYLVEELVTPDLSEWRVVIAQEVPVPQRLT
jgi:hypothetical protein